MSHPTAPLAPVACTDCGADAGQPCEPFCYGSLGAEDTADGTYAEAREHLTSPAAIAASHTPACADRVRIRHDENLSLDYPAPSEQTSEQREQFRAELDWLASVDLQDCVGCTCDGEL